MSKKIVKSEFQIVLYHNYYQTFDLVQFMYFGGAFSVDQERLGFLVREYSHGSQLSQVITGGLSGVFLFNNFIRFCYSGVERELC